MIKIIAASDNHGDLESINEIINSNSNADFYLHMGDGCCNPRDLNPFVSVKGNNDYSYDLPDYKVIELDQNNRVFMTHGHQYVFNKDKMIEEAKENNCNIILCGHTHKFMDIFIDDIKVVNPGSCFYNRDHSAPCYAIITIDNNEISVEKRELKSYIY